MYKYEYEKVSCELGGWCLGSGNIYEIDDYRSIIDKRAKEAGAMSDIFPQDSAEPDTSKSLI